jgi:hypothetical protein
MLSTMDLNDNRRPNWSAGSGFQAARRLGWKIMDRWEMTRLLGKALAEKGESLTETGWGPDGIHVRPYVNHEYTQVFLNMVCGRPV